MTQRYLSVDALRGLIMIFMAIDHSSAIPFLTRLMTPLCAPGFRRRCL